MMGKLFQQLPFVLMGIPIIFTYIFYKFTYFLSKNKWKAIHLSTQTTAIFYIVAVTLIIHNLFQLNVISYMLIFHIIVLAILLIIQWKTKIEVILLDGLKTLLRLSFLIFFATYICLSFYMLFDIIYQNYMG